MRSKPSTIDRRFRVTWDNSKVLFNLRVKGGNKRSLRNCWSSQLIMTRKSIVGFGFVLLCTQETRRERRREISELAPNQLKMSFNYCKWFCIEKVYFSHELTDWIVEEKYFTRSLENNSEKAQESISSQICSEFKSRKTSQNAITSIQLYEVIAYDWQFGEHFSRIIPLKRSLGTFFILSRVAHFRLVISQFIWWARSSGLWSTKYYRVILRFLLRSS